SATFVREVLQNRLHGRMALWRATRRLAYLLDRSCLLRLALHPVRQVLQDFLEYNGSASHELS
ncbi:MAG: hypothetical protein ORN21_03475, partial [Methylophilaceae bacterium]|nr:hypothetical protein [Methylophilaceae bacterium]